MYMEIKAAIDSVKVMSDILRASKELRNFNELASAVSEVYQKLLHALTAAVAGTEHETALAERVYLLEEENRQLKHHETEAKNYILQQVGLGTFAYVYQPTIQTDKPRHWACATCFENRQIFTLQRGKGSFYTCPHCGASIDAFKDGHFVSIDDAYKASQ